MNQDISSLMDGELDSPEAARTIRACGATREAVEKWSTYHLVGDVMRGAVPRPSRTATLVMERLRAEPTVLAPRRQPMGAVGRIALAAAASVATIGVVGWIGLQGGPDTGSGLVAKNPAAVPALQPVAATTAPVTRIAPPTGPLDVQDYLAAHRQIPSPELYRSVANRKPADAR